MTEHDNTVGCLEGWTSDLGDDCSTFDVGQANHEYCDAEFGTDGLMAIEACEECGGGCPRLFSDSSPGTGLS